MEAKYKKLQQDFDKYFSSETFSRNSCLVKVMDSATKELHPSHILFTRWYSEYILSFSAYLNSDLKTYSVFTNNIKVLKKVKPEQIAIQLSMYDFDVAYTLTTKSNYVIGFRRRRKKK